MRFIQTYLFAALLVVFTLAGVSFATITTLSLSSPGNNTLTANNTPGFAFTAISDTNTTFPCELFINATGYGTNSTVSNNTVTTIAANTTLSDGLYSWYINCTDVNGSNISEARNLRIDATKPEVASPAVNATLVKSTSSIQINVSANDTATNVTLVKVGNSTAVAMSNISATAYQLNTTTAALGCTSSGICTLRFNATDAAGNYNDSVTISLFVDDAAPSITLNSPPNATNTSSTVNFNWTATDNNASSMNCTLYVNGSAITTVAATNNTPANYSMGTFGPTIHNWTVTCNNSLGNSGSSGSYTFAIDLDAPWLNVTGPTNASTVYRKNGTTVNVTYTYNETAPRNVTIRLMNSTSAISTTAVSIPGVSTATNSSYNITVPSGVADGNYSLNVTLYDYAGNSANASYPNAVVIDNTPPTISFVMSTQSLTAGYAVTCTCSATDVSGLAASASLSGLTWNGVNTCTAPSSVGTYTAACSATDIAGNAASSSLNYNVSSLSGYNPAGAGSGGTSSKSQLWDTVYNNASAVMTIESTYDTGLSEISLNVINNAGNVQMTVIKSASRPGNIAADPTSKVYRYSNITLSGLSSSNLKNATIKFSVTKTWLTANNLTAENVFLWRWTTAWEKLNTTKLSEDTSYVYYRAITPGFSTFAIGGNPPACTDECSPSGAVSCYNTTAVRTCGNYDNDTCLEWGSASACAAGQLCSAGVCSTPLGGAQNQTGNETNMTGLNLTGNQTGNETGNWTWPSIGLTGDTMLWVGVIIVIIVVAGGAYWFFFKRGGGYRYKYQIPGKI